MTFPIIAVLTVCLLFLSMLLLLETGRRLGARRLSQDSEDSRAGLSAVEGAVFAIMGLLVAFTFSGAAARFDTRRIHIVDEANAIGTAWLRLDLLPAGTQPALQEKFRKYVDARLAVYRRIPKLGMPRAELAAVSALQAEIWAQAVAACREGPPSAAMLLLPSLNEMFDTATTRNNTARMHPPLVIYIMLTVLALTGSLLAGYGMAAARSRSWFHILAFVTIMTVTVYVILDLEFPRLGLIRIDSFDEVLIELRQSMGP